jgi:site-specific DNA recombinase
MKVIIYVRVSTADQAKEGYSIPEQLERLKKYCEAMDWTIVETFIDPGYSGGSLDRPGLKDMIRFIKAEKVDKVVVYKLDRLSRSQKDTLYLIEDVFLNNNTDFVSMNENFDTSTPFGRAMIGILAVFAQLEREQIKERMTMGREARAKQGYYTGSTEQSPIGYEYINGELVVNEYEKMLVNEVFKLFLQGTPIKTIGDTLNKRGYTHRYGDWTNHTIGRLLRNRHYIGEVRFADKWYPGRQESIVDIDIFEKAQVLLKYREDNRKSDNKHTTYLGGFIWCKKCGARYHPQFWYRPDLGNTKQRVYCCYSRSKKMKNMIVDPNCKNKNYKADELEKIVFDEIRKLSLDPNYLDEVKNSFVKDDESDDKVLLLKREISELSDQISNYMDLYSIKRLSLSEVDAKIEPLTERRAKLEEELDRLTEDNDENNLSDSEVIRLVNSFGDLLDNGNLEEVRFAISTLIKKIEIDEDDITIYWNFS